LLPKKTEVASNAGKSVSNEESGFHVNEIQSNFNENIDVVCFFVNHILFQVSPYVAS
jgi:hypothetical protein